MTLIEQMLNFPEYFWKLVEYVVPYIAAIVIGIVVLYVVVEYWSKK